MQSSNVHVISPKYSSAAPRCGRRCNPSRYLGLRHIDAPRCEMGQYESTLFDKTNHRDAEDLASLSLSRLWGATEIGSNPFQYAFRLCLCHIPPLLRSRLYDMESSTIFFRLRVPDAIRRPSDRRIRFHISLSTRRRSSLSPQPPKFRRSQSWRHIYNTGG